MESQLRMISHGIKRTAHGAYPQLLAVEQSVEESSGNRIMVEGLREIGRSTAGGIEHASTWEAVRVCSAGPFGLLGLIATSLV